MKPKERDSFSSEISFSHSLGFLSFFISAFAPTWPNYSFLLLHCEGRIMLIWNFYHIFDLSSSSIILSWTHTVTTVGEGGWYLHTLNSAIIFSSQTKGYWLVYFCLHFSLWCYFHPSEILINWNSLWDFNGYLSAVWGPKRLISSIL